MKESEARRGTLKRYRSLLQFVPCMSPRPGCPDHGTLRFPSGSWRGLEGAPSLAPDFTLTGLHFQASSNPPSFSSRIWRGRLVVTAHRISTGTRGQKPWCLGCSSNDGRPRRPRRHQICPHRHLIFSPPLPLAQPLRLQRYRRNSTTLPTGVVWHVHVQEEPRARSIATQAKLAGVAML